MLRTPDRPLTRKRVLTRCPTLVLRSSTGRCPTAVAVSLTCRRCRWGVPPAGMPLTHTVAPIGPPITSTPSHPEPCWTFGCGSQDPLAVLRWTFPKKRRPWPGACAWASEKGAERPSLSAPARRMRGGVRFSVVRHLDKRRYEHHWERLCDVASLHSLKRHADQVTRNDIEAAQGASSAVFRRMELPAERSILDEYFREG